MNRDRYSASNAERKPDDYQRGYQGLTHVRSAVKGADYILHQKVLPSVPRSIHDPRCEYPAYAENPGAEKEFCVKRVVFASVSSSYGINESWTMWRQVDQSE